MFVNFLVGFIGIVLFFFIFWKKLKEDYSSEIIFKSSFAVIVGILLGWGLSLRLIPQAFLWLSAVGAFGGLVYSNSRFKIRFFESLEAVVIAALPWISLIFLEDSVTNSNLISFIAFLLTLILIFVYYWFDQHYKEFAWYRSGKIGFSGLAILIIIFAIRLVVAIFRLPVISFFSYANAGLAYDIWADAVFLVVAAGFLVNLSRK